MSSNSNNINNQVSVQQVGVLQRDLSTMQDPIAIEHILFSPDGRLLAASAQDEPIWLWNLATRQVVRILDGHIGEQATAALAFSPDGTLLASSAAAGRIRLWNRAGEPMAVLESGEKLTGRVQFSPDGQLLAATFASGPVLIWTRTGQLVTRLTEHQGSPFDLAFAPNGEWLAIGDMGGVVHLWEVGSWRRLAQFIGAPELPGRWPDAAFCFAFSPDGSRLALRGWDARGRIQLWRLVRTQEQSLELRPEWLAAAITEPSYLFADFALAPDGRILAVPEATRQEANRVQLFDMQTFTPLGVLPIPERDFPLRPVFSPDGQLLVTPDDQGKVWLWDVASRQQAASFAPFVGEDGWLHGLQMYAIQEAQWSPDGAVIAISGLAPDPEDMESPKGASIQLWQVRA